jgi:hypothetical protein
VRAAASAGRSPGASLYRRLSGVAPDQARDDLPAPNPSGRVADPGEVAAFITGTALAMDGGATAG